MCVVVLVNIPINKWFKADVYGYKLAILTLINLGENQRSGSKGVGWRDQSYVFFLYGFIRNHSFVSDNFQTNLARKWMGQSTCPSTKRPFNIFFFLLFGENK